MTSVFAFFVWCLTGNFTVHKTPQPTIRSGLQSRDWNHIGVSSERTHFRPSWSVETHDLLREYSEGHAIGWLDRTSEVAFFELAGRLKPGPVPSEDKVLVDAGLKSVAQPAVQSNQCPGHPLPLLPTQVPGPQGWDWEWWRWSSFYVNTRCGRLNTSLPVN